MGKRARKGQRGGRREGAGRPPTLVDPAMLSFRVERELVEALSELAGGKGVSTYVRDVLERHVRARKSRAGKTRV